MKFIAVRDLRSRSAGVWRDLQKEGELVITSNGKPIAIVSATDEASFEQSLAELRQARALRAARQLQEQSAAAKAMDMAAIDKEIAAVRRGRGR
jgi:antitoxin (DNA-binding transcriptional repressor) of toxin-antitoxin stability system